VTWAALQCTVSLAVAAAVLDRAQAAMSRAWAPAAGSNVLARDR
jgi:hypothetical protein